MANFKQRLFFALWPEESVRKALVAAMEPMKPKLAAQWIRPANLHITLAFLGDVEAERVGAAYAAADAVSSSGFELSLDTLAHWRKPQILCLSPSAPVPILERFTAELAGQLQTAGFTLDKRPYRPHLTLARKAASLPADAHLERPIPWKSNAFVLVESSQDSRGSCYSILKTWPLSRSGIQNRHKLNIHAPSPSGRGLG